MLLCLVAIAENPDGYYVMDLENHEDRLMAAFLVDLAVAEPGENWGMEPGGAGTHTRQHPAHGHVLCSQLARHTTTLVVGSCPCRGPRRFHCTYCQ